jgi:hypothetical protein
MPHGLRAAEQIRHAQVCEMESLPYEFRIRIGERAEKLAAPGPGISGQRLFRHDDGGGFAVEIKVVAVEAFPLALLAGEGGGLCKQRGGGCQCDYRQRGKPESGHS